MFTKKVHGTVHQLSKRNETVPGQNQIFFSEIMGPRWLELPIARTHFDSLFEFEPAKFYCTYCYFEFLNMTLVTIISSFLLYLEAFLCPPRQRVGGGGGILIYPCPSVRI
jgi:hypothetical protein